VGKYSEETKLAVVEDYCSGTAGLKVVARRHDVNVASLRKWVAGYRSHGAAVLDLYNGEIVAYQMARRPLFDMVGTMLEKAFGRLKQSDKPILHSD